MTDRELLEMASSNSSCRTVANSYSFASILGVQTFYFGGVTGQASRCFRTSFAWPVAVPASS